MAKDARLESASGITAPDSYLDLWRAKKRSSGQGCPFLSCFALCRTRSSGWDMSCFRLCVRDMVCSSEFLLTQALLSPISSPIQFRSTSALSGSFDWFCDVGSEEAHLAVLASVRRSNWTCRFPASSFHKGERLLGCREGMRWINFSSPSSP